MPEKTPLKPAKVAAVPKKTLLRRPAAAPVKAVVAESPTAAAAPKKVVIVKRGEKAPVAPTAEVKTPTPPKPAAVEKPAKAPKAAKPDRVKLTDGNYNFALARFRRKAAEFFSDGDKDIKRELTTGLRESTTYKGCRAFLESKFQTSQIEDFLDKDFFVAKE